MMNAQCESTIIIQAAILIIVQKIKQIPRDSLWKTDQLESLGYTRPVA